MVSCSYDKVTYNALLKNNIDEFVFNYNMFILYNIKSKHSNIFRAYHLLILLKNRNYKSFNVEQYKLSIEEIRSGEVSIPLQIYLYLKMDYYGAVEKIIAGNKYKELEEILQQIKDSIRIEEDVENIRKTVHEDLYGNIKKSLNKI